MKQFIDDCVNFVKDLDLSHTEVDEMVRKDTNVLLSHTISSTLSQLVKERRLGLHQLTQVSVNTSHLEVSLHLPLTSSQAPCPEPHLALLPGPSARATFSKNTFPPSPTTWATTCM